MSKIALLAVVLATATPAFANPVDPANPDAREAERLAASCAPELKYAAGACVSSCPSGFADTGRICVFENESDRD